MLAGRRGPDDPLARAAGAPHRALLDLGGQPMLERVVETLARTPAIASIAISIDEPDLLRGPAGGGLGERIARGEIALLQSEDSPSHSVLAGLDALPADEPILLTTADHALLTREMVEHFLTAAQATTADLSVGLVSEQLIRERFPEAQRTYLPFRGERFSGANLFAAHTRRARRAVEFWTRAEDHRKQPWRLVGAFGPIALLLFLLRRLTLAAALERASRVVGARVQPVQMPFAEAAIDVDKLTDYELVKKILAARKPVQYTVESLPIPTHVVRQGRQAFVLGPILFSHVKRLHLRENLLGTTRFTNLQSGPSRLESIFELLDLLHRWQRRIEGFRIGTIRSLVVDVGRFFLI